LPACVLSRASFEKINSSLPLILWLLPPIVI
jgi:hypothetical protein